MFKNRYLWLLFPLLALLLPACSKQARRDRHLKQADHYFDTKDFKKAEVEYLNVLRMAPTNAWVVTRLATIYYDQGKTEQAARFLMGARQLDSENTQVRTRLAEILLSAGQFKQVREE